MGHIRTILQETRNELYQMKCDAGQNWLERAQYACQLWNIDRMIDIADGISKLHNLIKGKDKQNER